MTADELISLEETLFWVSYDLERVAAGEPPEDEEPSEPMTADEVRALFAHLQAPGDR